MLFRKKSKNCLKRRHDSSTQSRAIELAGEKALFVKETLCVYDLSGTDHIHENDNKEGESIKLIESLDKLYPPFFIVDTFVLFRRVGSQY